MKPWAGPGWARGRGASGDESVRQVPIPSSVGGRHDRADGHSVRLLSQEVSPEHLVAGHLGAKVGSKPGGDVDTPGMGDCCGRDGYDVTFGSWFSGHVARRYRRRGLDKTAARMVGFIADQGVDGASVLEIGGGVGDIQVELLKRGALRTTNLELVESYEADAKALADTAGVGDRITRRLVDIATSPDEVETHDIVVLHRVVCCYPDYQRLLGAAAAHATRMLVFSHPPRSLLVRAVFGTENGVRRLRRNPFRAYVHDPNALIAAAEGSRLRTTFRHRGRTWHIVALTTGAT
jgi:2-polyprenyl-3-methyl-5-hydroxy-6-metoxy-1,4-benzoquinol methylase